MDEKITEEQDQTITEPEKTGKEGSAGQEETGLPAADEKIIRPGQELVCFTKETEDRLARIEMLLISQAEHNRKVRRAAKVRNVALIVFVAVFAVGLLAFYNIVKSVTVDVPNLVVSANELVETVTGDINEVVQRINEVDFETLNETLKGVGSIDFDGINQSINGLSKGVAAFQEFAEALAKPANAVGSLFG